MLYAQAKVQSAYGKYSRVRNMYNLTGVEVARRLLNEAGLYDVRVEGTPGKLSDHYDPRGKVLRLSAEVANVPSVAAMGIVAHEVGHAIQDAQAYAPMRIRGALVGPANIGSNLGFVFLFLGLITQATGLVWLGIALFTAAVAFTLVTLPVELDASRRAMAMLSSSGVVTVQEQDGARAVLNAAAWTYVAALLQAVSTLLYYLFLVVGMQRDD